MNNKIEKQMIEAIERLVARANRRKPITLDVSKAKEDARRVRRDNRLNKN
tara:strand:+ start:59 stop:208 length:150 start_codon:yes stop_codon:yes gene_type:complete